MMSLTITACVRPYPGSEVQAEVSTVGPISTQPPTFLTTVPTIPSVPDSETPEPTISEPTPIPVEPTTEPQTESQYIVVAGDTLFKIALEFDVTVEDIAEANGIIDINSLEIGQELIIPAPNAEGSSEQTDGGQDTGGTEDSTNTGDNRWALIPIRVSILTSCKFSSPGITGNYILRSTILNNDKPIFNPYSVKT